MNKELVGQPPARQWRASHAARSPLPWWGKGKFADELRALGHEGADGCLKGGLKCGALHEVYAAQAGDEAAATGFVLALAIRVIEKGKWLLWVRQDFSALETGEISPTGLLAFGFDPSRLLIVKAADAAAVLKAGAEGLACEGLGAAIIEPWGEPKLFDLNASRRLMLAAAKHNVTVFALRNGAAPAPSAAQTRWLVRAAAPPSVDSRVRAEIASGDLKSALNPSQGGKKKQEEDWVRPRFDVELARNRNGATGHWVLEWDCDGGIFREKAHPRALAAAPRHGSLAAQKDGIRQAG